MKLQIIFCKNLKKYAVRRNSFHLDGGIAVRIVGWDADLEEWWLTVVQEDNSEWLEVSLLRCLLLLRLLVGDLLLLWLLLDGLD